jgi:hypothetical protein
MSGFPNTTRYLRDLADRIMQAPAIFTDRSDSDELYAIAAMLDELPMEVVEGWVEQDPIHDA